jgi:DNA-binding CsgD family transcriptional regulator
MLWDWEMLQALASRQVELSREVGALTMLPFALNTLAVANLLQGDLVIAAALIDEAAVVTDVTHSNFVTYAASQLASWRGSQAEGTAVIKGTIKRAKDQGQGLAVQFSRSSAASLYNGLGLYDKAVEATQDLLWDRPNWAPYLATHELVEAASRTGQRAIATEALERLAETTSAADTDWASGIEARSRALLASGAKAEAFYNKSISHLDRSPVRPEAARAHLLYGEWLRREGRRVDARKHLRIAHDRLGAMGIEAFAERARRELVATGETVRKRTVETLIDLTPQEVQIARLAADGRTNIEIGSQLFISPRTVEWHLRKVFTKLSVNSRRELRGVLPRLGSLALPG